MMVMCLQEASELKSRTPKLPHGKDPSATVSVVTVTLKKSIHFSLFERNIHTLIRACRSKARDKD